MRKKTQLRGDNNTKGQVPVEQAKLDAVNGGTKIWRKNSSKGQQHKENAPAEQARFRKRKKIHGRCGRKHNQEGTMTQGGKPL